MSAKHRTPLLIDSRILVSIIEDALAVAGADKALKPQVLNRAAARICGPKFDWGRITGSAGPVLAQSLSQDAADTTLHALFERPVKADQRLTPMTDALREVAKRNGQTVTDLRVSRPEPADMLGLPGAANPGNLASAFNAYFRSDDPFAMISGDAPRKLKVLRQEALRRGREIREVSLDGCVPHDPAAFAPYPGAINIYSNIDPSNPSLMMALMMHISRQTSELQRETSGAGTKAVFLAGDNALAQDIVEASVSLIASQVFSAGDRTRAEQAVLTAKTILDCPETAAVISWHESEVASQAEALAELEGIDVVWPCLKLVRFQTECDVGEVLPQPGRLTIYTDMEKADSATLRSICKSIISSSDSPQEDPARVLIQASKPEYLIERLRKIEPMIVDRLHWYRAS